VIVKRSLRDGLKQLKSEINDEIKKNVREAIREFVVAEKPSFSTSKDKGC
jgi:hypothetical protein